MSQPQPDVLYVAMARPILALGVPYMYLFLESIVVLGVFIAFKKLWLLAMFGVTHALGCALTKHEPHFFSIFLINRRFFVKNTGLKRWGGVSYHA